MSRENYQKTIQGWSTIDPQVVKGHSPSQNGRFLIFWVLEHVRLAQTPCTLENPQTAFKWSSTGYRSWENWLLTPSMGWHIDQPTEPIMLIMLDVSRIKFWWFSFFLLRKSDICGRNKQKIQILFKIRHKHNEERLSFDTPVAGDVQFIMIMTIFEWNLDFLLILATDVGFWK